MIARLTIFGFDFKVWKCGQMFGAWFIGKDDVCDKVFVGINLFTICFRLRVW